MDIASSGGLQSLQDEPLRLRVEGDKYQNALEELYRSRYETFIENHECMGFLDARGKEFGQDLDAIETDLVALKETCAAFEKGGAEIVASLKRSRQTLQHHLQLVELLEVPQLMDACVRNHLYEEAIELVAFANMLERRHLRNRDKGAGDEEPGAQAAVVISSIVNDLRALQRQLREKLLVQLRSMIQLPKCLQVISCLRKLDGLVLEQRYLTSTLRGHTATPEAERNELEHNLQVEFLEARDAWLQSVIDNTSSGHSVASNAEAQGGNTAGGAGRGAADGPIGGLEAHQRLMDVIEKNRTHWFEIATQFRAIFLDDDTRGSGAKNLSVWLLRRITSFLEQLESGLMEVTDGAAMSDLLEQCMFFGASMSRIGVDFRELLVPVFVKAAKDLAELHWTAAGEELKATLARCNMEGPGAQRTHSSGAGSNAIMCYVMPSTAPIPTTDNEGPVVDKEGEVLSPPLSLLTYPPLSQYTNLVLTSFNQLRQCTPWALVDGLQASFLQHLQAALKVLSHHRLVENRQAAAFKQLLDEAVDVMMPYLLRCFSLLLSGDGQVHKTHLSLLESQIKSVNVAEGLSMRE